MDSVYWNEQARSHGRGCGRSMAPGCSILHLSRNLMHYVLTPLHRSEGLGQIMEFRLTEGRHELVVFNASDGNELAEALLAHGAGGEVQGIHVHLWHSDAWWNLTSDLSQFATWLVEAKQMSPEDVAHFEAKPWQMPELLWEAACQLQRLLDAATGMKSGRRA